MTVTTTPYTALKALVDATQIIDDALVTGVPLAFATATDGAVGTGASDIFWLLSYVPDASAPVAPVLLVNGVPTLVKFGAPSASDTCPTWSIVKLTASVYGITTGSGPIPGAGGSWSLTYQYSYNAVIRIDDPAPIAAYKAVANRGVFTSNSSSASGLNEPQTLATAESQITGYSTPITKVDATIGEEYLGQGFRKGQQITFTSNRLGMLGFVMLITTAEWLGSQGVQQKQLHLTMEM